MAINSPIVLAGSGRSGTSWLLDVLAVDKNLRPIFEPLHVKHVPNAKNLWDLYLRAGCENAALEQHFYNVFEKRTEQAWFTWMHCRVGHNVPNWSKPLAIMANAKNFRFWARRRIAKVIKANLCLDWLQHKFAIKLIFMRRHPGGVLASRLKMNWNPDLDHYLKQPRLHHDFLADKTHLFKEAENRRGKRLALLWCIENCVPQFLIREGLIDVKVATYEDIVVNPEYQFKELFNYVGYDNRQSAELTKRAMKRQRSRHQDIHRWKNELSQHLINFTLKCADEFQIPV